MAMLTITTEREIIKEFATNKNVTSLEMKVGMDKPTIIYI